MGLLDRVKKGIQSFRYSRGTINTTNVPDYDPVSDFGGTRTTLPKFVQGGGGVFGALPKKAQRELGLDDFTLSTMSIEDLIDTLIDAHSDVSFAVWNFMRIGDSGYTVRVEDLEGGELYEEGLIEIQNLIKRFSQPNVEQFELSRDFDKIVDQLMLSTITRGRVL